MDEYHVVCDHRHGLYEVPLHEVLLSFNNDDDAIKFLEWFDINSKDFEDYVDALESMDAYNDRNHN